VFGGIERERGRCFLVEAHDRTAATLTREIEKCILPGSHIVYDGCDSYAQIDRIRGGIYKLHTFSHDNFVDHDEPNTHTKRREHVDAGQKENSTPVWHGQGTVPS